MKIRLYDSEGHCLKKAEFNSLGISHSVAVLSLAASCFLSPYILSTNGHKAASAPKHHTAVAAKHPAAAHKLNCTLKRNLDEIVFENDLKKWITHYEKNKGSVSEQFSQLEILNFYFREGLKTAPHVTEGLAKAVTDVESEGKIGAVSPTGATGPMQLTRRTSKRYGIKVNEKVDYRKHPGMITNGGMQYLEFLMNRYHGNQVYALIGYSKGEGVADAFCKSKLSWIETKEYIGTLYPKQKQKIIDYILRILALEVIYSNPEKHGIVIEKRPSFLDKKRIYHIKGNDSLATIAKKNRCNLAELKEYNPHVLNPNKIIKGEEIFLPAKKYLFFPNL